MTEATDQPFVFQPAVSGAIPAGGSSVSLVDQTQREISEIVREVAQAARERRPRQEFLQLLADRVLRAMAAEGVVIWQAPAESSPAPEPAVGVAPQPEATTYRPVTRLGRLTDGAMREAGWLAHQCLLREVGRDGAPVWVPPTPGATAADVPANPTELPAALAPITLGSDPDDEHFILEIFLEPGGGPATQRGYLRFVAQMADLAAEFLRADRLRLWRHRHELADRVDRALLEVHQQEGLAGVEHQLVDSVASCFGFARVGLCRLEGERVRLVAVSHVEQIAEQSDSAEALRRWARRSLDSGGCHWEPVAPRQQAAGEGVPETAANDRLTLRAIVAPDAASTWRVVCLDEPATPVEGDLVAPELKRLVHHGWLAAERLRRWEAVPGARWLSAIALALRPGGGGGSRGGRWQRGGLVVAACLLGIGLACFPAPLLVSARGTLRPVDVQVVCAHREAIVEAIHVRHGERVIAGDPLVTLTDPDLDERIATLRGRRAVLLQQQDRWTSALIDNDADHATRRDQLAGEQSLVEEEIRAVEQQLAILDRSRESLKLRADRDGRIDGWRLEERLLGRPLRRGEVLLQVVDESSRWVVDVEVPPKRIETIRDAGERQVLAARVALRSDPRRRCDAALERVGPTVASFGSAATAVRLRVDPSQLELREELGEAGRDGGTPVNVLFRCGRAPLIYGLFRDAIGSLRGTLGLYRDLGSWDEQAAAEVNAS